MHIEKIPRNWQKVLKSTQNTLYRSAKYLSSHVVECCWETDLMLYVWAKTFWRQSLAPRLLRTTVCSRWTVASRALIPTPPQITPTMEFKYCAGRRIWLLTSQLHVSILGKSSLRSRFIERMPDLPLEVGKKQCRYELCQFPSFFMVAWYRDCLLYTSDAADE